MGKTKVAAYIRMDVGSGDELAQMHFDLQKQYYTEYIRANPDLEHVGVYIDHGSGTWPLEKRPGLSSLLCDCRIGKVNLVLTKDISRLHRNIVECLKIVLELLELNPPVGFAFESMGVSTLDFCQ